MRMTRRGCYVARKEPRYVWAVYTAEYGYHADETTTPYTGTFTLYSTYRYKMAAKAYTATATTFTLTDAVQTTRDGFAVGDYLVDISTSSSTAVSGSYLYKITAISGSTFTYTRWQPTAYEQKTGAELYRVNSETMDYPIDGEQGGVWYVMVKGEYLKYVWDVFEYIKYELVEDTHFYREYTAPVSVYTASSYTLNQTTGKISLNSGKYENFTLNDSTSYVSNALRGMYYSTSPSNLDAVCYGVCNLTTTRVEYGGSTYNNVPTWMPDKMYESQLSNKKGSATGTTVESDNQSTYPQNGIQGNYWYTYSHSYQVKFDNR